MVSEKSAINDQSNFILVKDTKVALQKWAELHRKRFDFPVIGITGSNAKTIVKEWLFQMLNPFYTIVRSPRSYNSQIGVPLSLLQMRNRHNLGVFEAGISEPVEMVALEQMINPEIGVFTNIGDAHSSGFVSLQQKLNEKLQLFNRSKVLIHSSLQDEVVKAIESNKDLNTFSWGYRDADTLRIETSKETAGGRMVTLHYTGHSFELELPFEDEISMENCMHCVAVMIYLGKSPSEIQTAIQRIQPIEMRMFQKEGLNNCLIIEDYYNSDLHSLEIALDFAKRQHRGGRLTLILSDIYQSQLDDEILCREIVKLLASKEVDRLIAVGENLFKHKWLFKNMDAQFYTSTEELASQINLDWFANETLLLKGARQFSFEKLAKRLVKKIHQTSLEINLNSLANNLNFFRTKLKDSTKIMAMVKAHSYGSGSHQIAHLLQSKRIDYLAVAYTQEGVILRENGITTPIMVMNPEKGNLDQLLQYKLEANVYSFKILDDLIASLSSTANVKANIHIEFDTGMARLGFAESDLKKLIDTLQKHNEIKVRSVFSHLAAADETKHDDFTQRQCETFNNLVEQFSLAYGKKVLAHILNSAGALAYPQYQMDMIRLGIALYGINPGESDAELDNVYCLKSYISQIRYVPAEESIGYGRSGIVEQDSRVAILPIGYADGWNRLLSNGVGSVRIKGIEAPIVGNVCMDMCMVDVTHINCEEGDEVILFDSQDDIKRIATATGTIPYEVLTSISERVERVFVEE